MKCEEARLASEAVGGVTKLASALGIAPQAISQWKKIPAGRVLQIEAATEGRVTRHDLRPDLYPARGGPQAEPAAGEQARAGPQAAKGAPPEERAVEAAEALAAAARPEVRALSWRALAAVVMLILAFAAGTALWPIVLPRLGFTLPEGLGAAAPQLEERIAALEARLAESDRLSRALHGETARIAEAVAALEQRLEATADRDVAPVVERLRAEVEGLGDRLQALESGAAVPAEGEAGPAVEALGNRLKALETALAAALEETAGGAELRRETREVGQSLAVLSERVETLEEASLARAGRGAALVLALGQLRQALGGSGPYAGALSAVAALAREDEALAAPLKVLEPHAQAGVPTHDRLRARFAAIAGDIVRAEAAVPEGWLGAARQRLSALITVRRTGQVEGAGAQARVARAEERLEEGDLAGAVAELDGLEGAPARLAMGWLDDARARLAAEDALSDLQARAIARLGTYPQGQ